VGAADFGFQPAMKCREAIEKQELTSALRQIGTQEGSVLKNRFAKGKRESSPVQRFVAFVNRKQWWHVPPRDPDAYRKRGKFLASSYREAEFWGRPLMDSIGVSISNPLIGDEALIERKLFGHRVSRQDLSMERRWKLDAAMKRAALALGYDSILLMASQRFAKFRSNGQPPRSMELNVLKPLAAGEFPQ
jgi:hypothetical protein